MHKLHGMRSGTRIDILRCQPGAFKMRQDMRGRMISISWI
jgi:hypothetical protein